MSNISISEADFTAVAGAAMDAQRAGRLDAARALDKIARKINAALSKSATNSITRGAGNFCRSGKPLTWRDMPSTLL